MEVNPTQQQSLETKAFFDQQFFPVYGPPPVPASKNAAVIQVFRRHPFISLILVVFGLFCLESLWAANGYWGSEVLFRWRYEILAGGLSLLTLWLYRTFRQWGKERVAKETRRHQGQQEREALLKQLDVPAKPLAKHPTNNDKFGLTIDYWASRESVLIGEHQTELEQLPDEFIAPDALVLNFHLPEQN